VTAAALGYDSDLELVLPSGKPADLALPGAERLPQAPASTQPPRRDRAGAAPTAAAAVSSAELDLTAGLGDGEAGTGDSRPQRRPEARPGCAPESSLGPGFPSKFPDVRPSARPVGRASWSARQPWPFALPVTDEPTPRKGDTNMSEPTIPLLKSIVYAIEAVESRLDACPTAAVTPLLRAALKRLLAFPVHSAELPESYEPEYASALQARDASSASTGETAAPAHLAARGSAVSPASRRPVPRATLGEVLWDPPGGLACQVGAGNRVLGDSRWNGGLGRGIAHLDNGRRRHRRRRHDRGGGCREARGPLRPAHGERPRPELPVLPRQLSRAAWVGFRLKPHLAGSKLR
jgi:hypothetical protein